MSAAVLGVILVQIDLIRTSMSVNEERFDKNVQEALVKVTERLEDFEREYFFRSSVNGFMMAYQAEQIATARPDGGKLKEIDKAELEGIPSFERQFYIHIMTNPGLTELFNQEKNMRSVEERIKAKDLDLAILQEFGKEEVKWEPKR